MFTLITIFASQTFINNSKFLEIMPGRDKSGPLGQGPGTGRGVGLCATPNNDANTNNVAPGAGRGFGRRGNGGAGRGAGNGAGRGMGNGAGRGMGRRSGNQG